jgi:transcriptional regulator with XRE-family HTH domain
VLDVKKLVEPTRVFLIDLGKRLRGIREAKGLSQRMVAERIRTDRANYARIEHGKANVTIETLLGIAGAIGVDLRVEFGALADPMPRERRSAR